MVFKSLALKGCSKRVPCLQSGLTNLSSKTQGWGKRALDCLWLLCISRTKLGLTTVLKKVKFMMSGIYSTKHTVVLEGSADKQWPNMHEDLSSDPQYPEKNSGMAAHVCNPSLKRNRQEYPGELLPSQSS